MLEYSLIIPLYNKAKYVERALKSALNQIEGSPSEVIIVDDGSTDGSLDIVRSISDSRIRIIERGIPGPGGYAARNRGIKEAKYEWICFLDADDFWYPDSISDLIKFVPQNINIDSFSRGWNRSMGDKLEEDAYYLKHKDSGFHTLSLKSFVLESISVGTPVHTNTVLIKKTLLLKAGGFPEDEKRGGDSDLWLRCMVLSNKLGYLPKIGACYNLSLPGAVTTSNNNIYLEHPVRKTVKRLLKTSEFKCDKRVLKKYSDFKIMDWMEEQKRRKKVSFNSFKFLYYPFSRTGLRMFLAFVYHKIVD